MAGEWPQTKAPVPKRRDLTPFAPMFNDPGQSDPGWEELSFPDGTGSGSARATLLGWADHSTPNQVTGPGGTGPAVSPPGPSTMALVWLGLATVEVAAIGRSRPKARDISAA